MHDGPRVVNVITRLDVGGAQETVVRSCVELRRRSVDAIILAGTEQGHGGDSAQRAADAGVPVISEPRLRSSVGVSDVAAVMAVRRHLRAGAATIVHTHSSKAGVIGRLAARSLGLPVVHTVHGWSFNDEQPAALRRSIVLVERSLAKITDALVVVSEGDARLGFAHGIGRPDQYHLIRSGISFDELAAAAGAPPLDAPGWERPIVATIGRLAPQKDPLSLVRAFAEMRASLQRGSLVIVGDGPLRGAVLAEARRLGVSASVHVLGVRADATAVLARADVFALPSRWEGLPRAMIEAMVLGIPVVATCVGGVGDVLRDGETGFVVSVGDVSSLANAFLRALRERHRAAVQVAAARRQTAPFSQESMADALADLYATLREGAR
jgi:glycosyltransferase involved in cell wall biosynthesis